MHVERKNTVQLPAPLSVSPTQFWDGNDGPWSSFYIGVGTPLQYLRVLISTTSVQPWVVLSEGCSTSDPGDCSANRGGLFFQNESSSWQDKGVYDLIYERNLGIDDNGDFGLDSVALGIPGMQTNASLSDQIVAGIAAKGFYLATWGIRPASTNLSSLNNQYPSLIANLKDQSFIPSLSWGYTAGSYANSQGNKNSYGSLIFGGYDAARSEGNRTTYTFAPEQERDLIVGIQSIVLSGNATKLLPEPALAFIDAGVPHIWLPLAACQLFEDAFQLTYNSTLDLYLINSTIHPTLLASNPHISISLANDLTDSDPSSTFVLSYANLALTLTPDYPGIVTNTLYFPLRRAANTTQVTLGRAFLQEVYLIADYERSSFSLSQAVFPASATQELRPILPLRDTVNTTPSSENSGLTAGSIAGIVVGVLGGVGLVLAGLYFLFLKRRTRKKTQEPPTKPEDPIDPGPEIDGTEKTIGELHGKDAPMPELLSPVTGETAKPATSPRTENAELEGGQLSSELEGAEVAHEIGVDEISRYRGVEGDGIVYELQASELTPQKE